jgi:hypothetical protein
MTAPGERGSSFSNPWKKQSAPMQLASNPWKTI